MKNIPISQLNALKPTNSRLTAFAYGISEQSDCIRKTVICWCDCGRTKKTLVKYFKSGSVTNCGQSACKRGNYKHGFAKENIKRHPLYTVWNGMKSRCYSMGDTRYHRYGGRGIIICEIWLNDFNLFFNWAISNGWNRGLQIDRIDNDGNYEPHNCRFVTLQKNAENKSNSIKINYMGKCLSTKEWSYIFNIKPRTIEKRFKAGWDLKDVFFVGKFKPFGHIKNIKNEKDN